MAITIQEERFSDVIEEAQPLLVRHWEEIAQNKDIIPLSPNYGRYAEMESKNKLCVVTARMGSELIGYACFFVDFWLHYSTVMLATSDIIWVAPEHRGMLVGNRLIRHSEMVLRGRGVMMVRIMAKSAHPALAKLLSIHEYGEVETVLAKVLQRPE